MWRLSRRRWTTGSAPSPTSWKSLRWPYKSSASGCTLRCVDTVAHRLEVQRSCLRYLVHEPVVYTRWSIAKSLKFKTFYSLSFSLRTFSLVRIYGNSCQRSQLTLMGSTRTGRSVVCTSLEKVALQKPFPLLHHISTTNKILKDINKQSQNSKKFSVQKCICGSPG